MSMQTRRFRIAFSVLALTASFLTGAGLLLSAAIKNNTLADLILSHYPRYALAMKGFETLQDFKHPLPSPPGSPPVNAGVVSIDDPEWNVLLDFIQSETATRKSERNEPSNVHSQPAPPSPEVTNPPTQTANVNPPPDINFSRIKTITSFRVDVPSAGTKPLAPPFRLLVIWPNELSPVGRRVYEFLSPAEFKLDLRRFVLDEIEEWSLWMAVIAFAVSLPAEAMRRIIESAERRKTLQKLIAEGEAETTVA